MNKVEIIYDIVKEATEDVEDIYESYLIRLVGHEGLELLLEHDLLEDLGVYDGNQMYALCEWKED